MATSPTTSTQPSTTTTPSSSVPAEAATTTALADILPATLDGYRTNSDAKGTGALDIEAAAAAESDADAERALLETRHFYRGLGRAFTNGDTDVYMAVYEFASAEDAAFYLIDGFIALEARGAVIYDVPDILGARGFSQTTESDKGPAVVHGVAFPKGPHFVLVFTRSGTTSTPEEAKQLASELYARA